MVELGLRACAVFLERGHVLLQQGDGDSFWALPGGHLKFGELSREALAREIAEELSIAVRVLDLLWVVENLFFYGGRRCHETGFYYRAEAPDLPSQAEFRGREPHLLFRWFELPIAVAIDIRPRPLREKLLRIGPGIEHLAWRED